MVVIDEAAMVPDPVHDALAPKLVRTNGALILASTPRKALSGRQRLHDRA